MREFLKGLELEAEVIDTIMAEHGKLITQEKEKNNKLEEKVKEYEKSINDLSGKAQANEEIQKELETLKSQVADRELNDKILEAIGEKKFVNDFTKNAIIDGIKKELNEDSNKGKSINDILESFTNGKEGIFVEEKKQEDPKATGTPAKVNSNPQETGVNAILKAKHPELFE